MSHCYSNLSLEESEACSVSIEVILCQLRLLIDWTTCIPRCKCNICTLQDGIGERMYLREILIAGFTESRL